MVKVSVLLLLLFASVAQAESLYDEDSPWNKRIGANPQVDLLSKEYVGAMHGPFGSNPNHYTIPLYRVNSEFSLRSITIRKYFSLVSAGGSELNVIKGKSLMLPWPATVRAAKGKDANFVLWNPKTGDEWGFWHTSKIDGRWQAENGYYYNTNWSGVPPVGFRSRGAGVPYLAGLVLRQEIDRGRIDHAIAFGVNYPADWYVYPATKTDSVKKAARLLPMGARLQLDPKLNDQDFARWKLSRAGVIIARALQDYGMILVSGSGHPKIYVESENTAKWQGEVHKNTVKNIPYDSFRLLSLN